MAVPDKVGTNFRSTGDNVEEPATATLSSEESPIWHILEWNERLSGKKHQLKSDKPFDLSDAVTDRVREPEPSEDEESEAAFHLIRTIYLWEPETFEKRQEEKADMEAANHAQARDGKKKDVSLKDLNITEVGHQTIEVESKTLKQAIRQCVEYYPYDQDDYPERCSEPFRVLVYHMKELREMSVQANASNLKRRHLATLVKFMDSYLEPRITPLLKTLQLPKPRISFKDLWMLFKPGTEVYWRFAAPHFSHVINVSVVIRVEYCDVRHHPEILVDSFMVDTWGLATDGEKLGRERGIVMVGEFEGEAPVTSLRIYPCEIADREDGGATRRSLIARGKRMFEVMKKMPLQMWHDGYPFFEQKIHDQSHCVIDARTACARSELKTAMDSYELSFLNREITLDSRHTDMNAIREGDEYFKYVDYPTIRLAETEQLRSETHYLLCQPMLAGYSLYNKSYGIFYVDSLKEVDANEVMGDLVIDSANRDLIMALSHAQFQPINLDTIHNKGEGQVILLHGPPGVGKTFTVECIATSTGRPLIALTLGDLLAEESKVEETLLDWFTLAERWKAILLLDEADIFLERRASKDIQRNGIVSMFLRRMEYFRGTLFLTTNRVGQIDDAFLSRVSVVLQYDRLSDDTRKKIWEGFFQKLQIDTRLSNGRKVEVDKYAKRYVLNDPEVKNLSWNGREIRNALQTAIHLASYQKIQKLQIGQGAEDTIDVEEEHFKSVVNMSQKFKDYMQEITGQDEHARAKARLERND